ncbi:alpha/beta fold hydrolase [Streptomyces sp. NPDC059895]|uniref:alpha/beta fold hydrolase n=1 Tax=Streptomyces sp. NPDC059895 TaxID=3346992 RepID=UPI00365E7EEA
MNQHPVPARNPGVGRGDALAYDIRGSGPGLVLLPGIGGCPASGVWGTVPSALAAEHTVLLPDLPGSGRSALPAGELRTDTVAEQVVETARVAGLRDFVIAGTSLGAAVAVTVAARHPDRVRGLFTLAGFARPRTPLWLRLEQWAAPHTRADDRDRLNDFLASLLYSESYLTGLTPTAAKRLTARLAAAPTPGTVRHRPAPSGRSGWPWASTSAPTFPPSPLRHWSSPPWRTGWWPRSTPWNSRKAYPAHGSPRSRADTPRPTNSRSGR